MTYSTSSHQCKANSFFDWLSGFDTRVVEFGCALRLLALAANVISYDDSGKSVAPFLSSTLFAFEGGSFTVLFGLAIIGLWQLLALAKDTQPKRHGLPEAYINRFWSSLAAAACCTFLVLAMAGVGSPLAVVITYSLSMNLNLFNAIVLWVKHEDEKSDDKGAL